MIRDCLSSARSAFFSSKSSKDSRMLLVIGAICCAILPLDLSQLPFVLVGAIAYALLLPHKTGLQTKKIKSASTKLEEDEGPAKSQFARRVLHQKENNFETRRCQHETQRVKEPATKKTFDKSTTIAPVIPATFSSDDFKAQVQELLSQLAISPETDAAVKRLSHVVQRVLRPLFPKVEVVGFAHGDIARSTAFGVAVPDVDILVKIDETALANKLGDRMHTQAAVLGEHDARKLQKSAIRTCTDRLVGQGGIKFRRSAFKGNEPKVTLLAPASLVFDKAIAFDFSMNATTPSYHAELIAECERIDPRAKALILLVKRWAKDRGICHAPKGYLSPYLWSILAIYFLQVNDESGPILPALGHFKLSPSIMQSISIAEAANRSASSVPSATSSCDTPVSELLKQFFDFYANKFDWRNEAISIRAARRAPPHQALPLNFIIFESSHDKEVGPSIEDPFDTTNNLGSCCNAASFTRLKSELLRAHEFCSADTASLAELLQLWVPADAQADSKKEVETNDLPTMPPSKWGNSCAPWRRK